jgi:hypothetical protein
MSREALVDLDWRVPPQGEHDAIITAVEFEGRTNTTMVLVYRLQFNGEDFPLREELTIKTKANSPAYFRTAEAKGRIFQIARIYGLNVPRSPNDEDDIRKFLLGRELRIRLIHKDKFDLPVPVIARIVGKASAPVPPPISGRGL